ncbi:MAG TPA: glycosyltransferase family 1 protein [Micromonosporaceae bacterium]|nr:glycosyltransferase family 1 protein [Micromonosporaceae bacterium]
MRIAIITESFPPDVNGVAHSVVRVAEHLVTRGHRPIVIAPEPASAARGVTGPLPYEVIRVPSVPVPGYRSFRLGLPSAKLTRALVAHATDLVHLASPFVLGARGVAVAGQLGLPSVAVYQTDMPAYARAYRAGFGEDFAWRWLRTIHNGANRTLAPSRATAAAIVSRGIHRVWLWGRGVDTVRFDPAKRHRRLRQVLAPNGETIIGYVGRLAVEKQVDLLAPVCRMPGVRVVIVGDGPERRSLAQALPGALFLGERHGEQLARLYASLDVFVHTGPYETFGQTVQEALASGVPVVAPAAGGPLDLVTPGRTGFLVTPGDPAAFAGAVAQLVASPELRREYGMAARESVEGRTWAAVGDELIDHYTAVLDGRSARVLAGVVA